MNGIRVNTYPSRLSDNDLDELQALAFRSFDRARVFCQWLVETIQAEQLRRLQARPVTRCEVPANWRGADLASALITAHALSFGAPSYAAGRFADDLALTVTGMAASRLESA